MARPKIATLSSDPSVDLTPMIDVTFQLIIFFMVISALYRMENEAKLVLPIAVQSYVEDNPNKHRLVVNIERSGTIVIFGQVYTQGQLRAHLKGQYALLKQLEKDAKQAGLARTAPIVIRGDKLVRFENVRGVLAVIQQAGFENLQFAAYHDPTTALRTLPED